ncbi:P-loop containing nucleoside triphosphate hydrolase protein [Trametes versicolor FP-101664 SS1]|uniref:p-loop containing nucleoside triphosphate hydrolase protein n=1 Tax=Trametes versicolor (strain FP-101664) TaxID=717944 RepID=R7S6V6_TRAVS|nr:P-loop containing nucleoside triphosphate hydrolase protein [Trametes versicolor FP-101664 SS1]EIW51636.1 P-loop containing nucleoside triphosphate hydrolase protein [Trametes versicolor FP-101664 SS1]
MYSSHVSGKYHRAKVAKGSDITILCPICNTRLAGEATWLQHINSTDHCSKAQATGKSASVYPRDPSTPSANFCLICKRSVPMSVWTTHLRGVVHQRLQQNAQYRSQYEQAELGQHGVAISNGDGGLDLGVVSVEDAKKGLQRQLTITLDASAPAVSITGVAIFPSVVNKATSFSASTSKLGKTLVAGTSKNVHVIFRQEHRGRFQDRLEVTFKILSTERTFLISRSLRAVVGNAADHELLRPAAPYVRRGRAPWKHGEVVGEGDRPPALDAVQWAKPLPPSLIPSNLADILSDGNIRDVLNQVRARFLPEFRNATHGQWFRVLLWVEESRMVEDLHTYDIEGAQFTKEGRLYTLPVPGLSEKRPSVVKGDAILAQIGGQGHTHKGYVHHVRRDDICVSFNASFKAGARYTVRFLYNRTPIRRQHQALLASSAASQRLLFPIPGFEGLAQAITPAQYPLTLYNTQIATNAAQLQAVKSILQLRTGAAPFIVFGPPGTGKTVTIVEAIRQILRRQPDARILACAPSNSAADLLSQRLSSLNPSQLFRCNAVHRDLLGLPEDLVPYTFRRNDLFTLPPIAVLRTYKVIVTTCGNASFAYNIGMPEGHFTHIFIDEAGQGSEPEVLTAIKTVATVGTHVVLSGDPKQLGPVIRSSVARELGLGKSYLERLMEMPVYDSQTGRGRSFVKLLNNFRSHQAILDYPNAQFYNNELQVCGATTTINALLGSPVLVSPRWPVVFHYISGENERESTSPSYFNIDEATEVLDYIKRLLKDRQHPVRAEDIGIITPYYAQVRRIRLLLSNECIEGAKVGSVEEFQGQERKVIIVSTVRSTRDLLSYDAKFTLGFVSNPRRFNVAITRAQALLVVIGDASVLSIDPLWRAFMNYVHLHNGWRGDAPTWDTSAPVQMDGNYAAEIRDAAAADVEAFMARLGLDDDDVEGDANMERPFQETE